MAARISPIFVIAFITFQIFFWSSDASIVKREADPKPSETQNSIDNTVESIKNGVSNFVQRVRANQLYQNATQILVQAGESAHKQIQQLYEKINKGSAAK